MLCEGLEVGAAGLASGHLERHGAILAHCVEEEVVEVHVADAARVALAFDGRGDHNVVADGGLNGLDMMRVRFVKELAVRPLCSNVRLHQAEEGVVGFGRRAEGRG
jgi:hypothetical protein